MRNRRGPDAVQTKQITHKSTKMWMRGGCVLYKPKGTSELGVEYQKGSLVGEMDSRSIKLCCLVS